MSKDKVKCFWRRAEILALYILCIAPSAPLAAQGRSPTPAVTGALIGAGAGVGAGLLFAHEACNMDPCITAAYVVASSAGGAMLGGAGALIGALAGRGDSRAGDGALLGGILGAATGVVLVATSCEEDECGVAGYTSVALTGAGIFGALGALIGRGIEPSSSRDFDAAMPLLGPILAPVPGGMVIGARFRM